MSITENEIYTAVKNRTNGEIIENASNLEDMAKLIHDEDFEHLVAELRRLDESESSEFKKSNFSGFFPSQYINEDGKNQHNGIIQIDIDQSDTYTTEYITELKIRLSGHNNIFMMFNSVTTGLKVFVRTNLPPNTPKELHRKAYFEVVRHLELPTLKDNCGQEINRFCYLSSDKDIIYNADSEILELDITGLENEIKQLELLKKSDIDVKEYNSSEILNAFEFINRSLNYDQRLEVNFAMFSIYGAGAIPLLLEKWDVGDRHKLKNDLKTQLSLNQNQYSVGTIFHFSHLGGYKPLFHNCNIKTSNRPPKYSLDNLYSIDVAENLVKNKVSLYFNGISQFLNVSLGVGKTQEVIVQCTENTDKNIDILLESHARCEEYIQVFNELKGPKWTAANVIHMKGRNFNSTSEERNCFSIDMESNVISLNRGKFCKKCLLQDNCSYVQQFQGTQAIRLYTHNHLFQRHSNWDTRIPSHVIVDENIISKIATADVSSSQLDSITENLIGGKSIQAAVMTNYRKLEEITIKRYDHYSIETRDIAQILYDFANNLKVDPTAEFDFPYEIYESYKNNRTKNYLKLFRSHRVNTKYDNATFLFLDGTSNETLVKKVFPNVAYSEIKVRKDPTVKVIQHATNTFSRSYLKSILDINDISTLLKKYSNGYKNIGLITYQHLHENDDFYSEMAKSIGANEYGYFGAVRGTNKFIGCDLLIILGRHQVGTVAIESIYKNLHSKNCINTKQVIGSDVWMGHAYENQIYTYLDPDLQSIAEFTNNSETEQAIGRARSIRDNGAKTVLILNNVVFNIEVDELIVKNTTTQENEIIERIENYLEENKFLVATNKRLSESTTLNVRVFENFDRQLAVNYKITLKTIAYKINGKLKTIEVYCFDDYEVTEDDLKSEIKSKRGFKIIK